MTQLSLVCPRCRHFDGHAGQLVVHPLLHNGRLAVAGALDTADALECRSPHCGARYPVIQGVPVIFAGHDALSPDANPVLDPTALPVGTRLAIATNSTPANPLVETLARLARCATSGFGDWMPALEAPALGELDAPHARALMCWLDTLGVPPGAVGWRAILGSAMGREAWHDGARATLLSDAWLPALLAARRLLRDGRLDVIVPEEPGRWREVAIEVPGDSMPATEIACVCCDALDPPFHADTLDEIVLSNVVDSIADPWMLLGQCNALLADGGRLVVSSPMTWRASITAPTRWLSAVPGAGGDSERGLLAVLEELAPQLRSLARTEIVWSQRNTAFESVVYRNIAHCLGRGAQTTELV